MKKTDYLYCNWCERKTIHTLLKTGIYERSEVNRAKFACCVCGEQRDADEAERKPEVIT